MGNKKRRQHFVFQAYLRAWTGNNKLWCVRNGDEPFNTRTENVANERDFYRIKSLNDDERKLYDFILSKTNPDVKKALIEHSEHYLAPIGIQQDIQMISEFFKGIENIPEEIKDEILKLEKLADIAINNTEEDYHCGIEGESIKWIDALKNRDLSFYYEPEKTADSNERYDFLFFVCTQYFRTKAVKERWILTMKPTLNNNSWKVLNVESENISLENLSHHVLWFVKSLCFYEFIKKNSHLTLLVNDTDTPFVTSDQPIINLKADYQNLSNEASELIFYYPISPTVAITVNDENRDNEIKLTKQQVDEYNWKMITSSHENIFANNIATLNRYGLG